MILLTVVNFFLFFFLLFRYTNEVNDLMILLIQLAAGVYYVNFVLCLWNIFMLFIWVS
jgi:hypothetical protein